LSTGLHGEEHPFSVGQHVGLVVISLASCRIKHGKPLGHCARLRFNAEETTNPPRVGVDKSIPSPRVACSSDKRIRNNDWWAAVERHDLKGFAGDEPQMLTIRREKRGGRPFGPGY